jgi:hypothetical protein
MIFILILSYLIFYLFPFIIMASLIVWGYRFKKIKSDERRIFHSRLNIINKFLIFQILIFLVAGIFNNLLPGSFLITEPFSNKSISGKLHYSGTLDYEYHSDRGFNGDGYSIYIYQIYDPLIQHFQNNIDNLSKSYPNKPWYREDWQTKKWSIGPIPENEIIFFDFSLPGYVDMPNDYEIKKEMIYNLIKTESNYYFSYHYKMHDERPDNIDFYLVFPNKKIFVIINHNT